MQLKLDVSNSEEYFNRLDEPKEIDWEETGSPDMISLEEEDLVSKIITCEASIFLLREVAGGYGHMVSDMEGIRANLCSKYWDTFKKEYVSFNNYY